MIYILQFKLCISTPALPTVRIYYVSYNLILCVLYVLPDHTHSDLCWLMHKEAKT